MNVLKVQQRTTILLLFERGLSEHEINRDTGIHRTTIRRYQREWEKSKCPMATVLGGGEIQNAPPRPPDGAAAIRKTKSFNTTSACEPHREWIESQVALGRNAVSIYQDLVEQFAFTNKYNSVKRFVGSLKAREPERSGCRRYGTFTCAKIKSASEPPV